VFSHSMDCGLLATRCSESSELLLRPVLGRMPENLGLIAFAFFRPDVHQRSRSAVTEPFELFDVSIDPAGVARWRARRSLRSPTFSVPGSAQVRSAANMADGDLRASRIRMVKGLRTKGSEGERAGR